MKSTPGSASSGDEQGKAAMGWLPVALGSMFERPRYLEPSAWFEHVPFAMWVVEAHRPRVIVELGTHYGTSYFAFCQAVAELQSGAQCYAVDTWKGDEHAGFYPESVYETVRAHNDAHYSAFSRLVRSTFDEARAHFTDGSIDLLHIDGLHTLEAVTHDFETWVPKLSDRAVVLLHDTNVRERGFGVFMLFEQLRERYPMFEFVHGHGLGVLGVGERQTGLMRTLFESGKDGSTVAIRELFSHLGRACADAFASRSERQRALASQEQLKQSQQALDVLRRQLDELKADRSRLDALRERRQAEVEAHALERGQLVERFQEARESANALRSRLEAAEGQYEALARTRKTLEEALVERDGSMATLQQENRSLAQDRDRAEVAAAEAREEVGRLKAELARVNLAAAKAREEVGRLKAELARVNLAADKAGKEAGRLKAGLAGVNAATSQMKSTIAELRSELENRFGETATLTRALFDAQAMLARQRRAVTGLKEDIDAIRKSRPWRVINRLQRLRGRPTPGDANAREAAQRAEIEGSGLFDADWYLEQYPDVARDGVSPSQHYLEFGASELRDPSPRFSTRAYLEHNPDVAVSGMNPLLHFIRHGVAEGRQGEDAR